MRIRLKVNFPKYTDNGSEYNFKNNVVNFSSSATKVLPNQVIHEKKITIQYSTDSNVVSISLPPAIKYINATVINTNKNKDEIAYFVLYSDLRSFLMTADIFIVLEWQLHNGYILVDVATLYQVSMD